MGLHEWDTIFMISSQKLGVPILTQHNVSLKMKRIFIDRKWHIGYYVFRRSCLLCGLSCNASIHDRIAWYQACVLLCKARYTAKAKEIHERNFFWADGAKCWVHLFSNKEVINSWILIAWYQACVLLCQAQYTVNKFMKETSWGADGTEWLMFY